MPGKPHGIVCGCRRIVKARAPWQSRDSGETLIGKPSAWLSRKLLYARCCGRCRWRRVVVVFSGEEMRCLECEVKCISTLSCARPIGDCWRSWSSSSSSNNVWLFCWLARLVGQGQLRVAPRLDDRRNQAALKRADSRPRIMGKKCG